MAGAGQRRAGRAAGQRRGYPVFDLDLREVGALDAPYPTNIPWPTLLPRRRRRLLVGFNGAAYGGELVGYGTHGDVVLQRAPGRPSRRPRAAAGRRCGRRGSAT